MIPDQVEVLAVAIPPAIGQGHASDADFHQATGHQQLIVDGRSAVELVVIRLAVAVPLPDFLRLFGQIQGLEQLAGGQHAEGAIDIGINPGHGSGGIQLAAHAVKSGH